MMKVEAAAEPDILRKLGGVRCKPMTPRLL